MLRTALSLPIVDNLLAGNPVESVPNAKHQKRPPDPFSRDEAHLIIAEAQRAYDEQVHNLIEFWFWTGLRTSEILGLEWQNVDLANGTMIVAKAFVRGQQLDRTKTKVLRVVHLNSRALAALHRQRTHTQITGNRVFHDPRYSVEWADEDARVPAHLLGHDVEAFGRPIPASIQHAA